MADKFCRLRVVRAGLLAGRRPLVRDTDGLNQTPLLNGDEVELVATAADGRTFAIGVTADGEITTEEITG